MHFIESILFRDGNYCNIDLHQARINRTFKAFMPSAIAPSLTTVLPDLQLKGTYKARIVYDTDSEDADIDLEFIEYFPRSIETLEAMHVEPFDYFFKYEDRTTINRLFDQTKADDIVMYINGLVTDSSYANLAFWNGTEWLTPEKPLLEGVRRAQLLKENRIKTAQIFYHDIKQFERVSLINAMLDLGELSIDVQNITL